MSNSKVKVKVDTSKTALVTSSQLSKSGEFLWNGRLLRGEDAKCRFVGATDTQPPTDGEKWCVGVLGDDGLLKVYPAKCVTLRQSVKDYDEQLPTLKGAAVQYRALFEDFGSAKKRKVLKSREANRLVSNDSGKKDTRGATAEVSHQQGPSAEELATEAWRKSFLPKWDAEAKDPRDAYNMMDIAGGELPWTDVEKEANRPFSGHLFSTLQSIWDKSGTSAEQKTCLVVCHYFGDFYTRFNRRPITPIDYSRGSFYGQPFSFAENLLTKFSTESADGRRSMSRANQDSCLVHLFLMFIMACHGKKMESHSIREFANDLRLESATVVHLLRQAGLDVSVKRAQGTVVAKLKTPLKFPAAKRHLRR